MTGDDHGNGGTAGRFDQLQGRRARPAARSPTGSASARPRTSTRTRRSPTRRPRRTRRDGFEVGAAREHRLRATSRRRRSTTNFDSQLAAFAADVPERAGAGDQPHALHRLERLGDPAEGRARRTASGSTRTTTTGPPAGCTNRPGLFTGSGMPMRFADARRHRDRRLPGDDADDRRVGTDVSRRTVDTLLDNALGPKGYYGAFTANMHTDHGDHAGRRRDRRLGAGARRAGGLGRADARLARRPQRLVVRGPELERRRRSRFTIAAGAGANGLQAMLPTQSAAGDAHRRSPAAAARSPTETQTIKGIEYAFFAAVAGDYVATYAAGCRRPRRRRDVADFAAGTPGAATSVGASGAGADGEVQLLPTVGQEFEGSALPADWFSDARGTGRGTTVAGGALVTEAPRQARTASSARHARLEFTGTFGADTFQHAGFAVDYDQVGGVGDVQHPRGGAASRGLYARTNGPRRRTRRSRSLADRARTATGSSGRPRRRLLRRRRPGGDPRDRRVTSMRPLISDFTVNGPTWRCTGCA